MAIREVQEEYQGINCSQNLPLLTYADDVANKDQRRNAARIQVGEYVFEETIDNVYACDTWPTAQEDENRLAIMERKFLRKTYGRPKRIKDQNIRNKSAPRRVDIIEDQGQFFGDFKCFGT
ncbi:Uncharacterized protein FWK35_00002609 [Aphis craccivora]|uniref:Uncharacterized protein n=1 Tax=Aphis craccivora TaxID=307492 RepID=A0A6G0ZH44_APHCR|nr:Uncharacterized protein FWK35_00002609 [Aphis craccivora]